MRKRRPYGPIRVLPRTNPTDQELRMFALIQALKWRAVSKNPKATTLGMANAFYQFLIDAKETE